MTDPADDVDATLRTGRGRRGAPPLEPQAGVVDLRAVTVKVRAGRLCVEVRTARPPTAYRALFSLSLAPAGRAVTDAHSHEARLDFGIGGAEFAPPGIVEGDEATGYRAVQDGATLHASVPLDRVFGEGISPRRFQWQLVAEAESARPSERLTIVYEDCTPAGQRWVGYPSGRQRGYGVRQGYVVGSARCK